MEHENPRGALLVADYLLLRARQEGVPITNKKLQKLLYYVQAWSAALNNKKVYDDRIEAWVHGPAIKSVYLAFQAFGANPIKKDVDESIVAQISEEAKTVIDQVWDIYKKYDADYLEYLTHSEKPWQEARASLEPHVSSENEISFESMRAFYRTKLTAGV